MSICRFWHNHINTMRFALSNSVHSMLIQPFYIPIRSLFFFAQSLSLNVSAEVSLITHNRIHPERWQSLRWSIKPSFIKPKPHCRFQTSMTPDHNLSQNNPADKLTHSHCFTIKSDKIPPSTATYTKWYLSCRFYVCLSLRSEWHSLPTSTSITYRPNNNFVKSTTN